MQQNHVNKKNQLIIKKKSSNHGHDGGHSGSWKIAFADFAVAMMAFFLLMWILNATNKAEKEAISSYFEQPSEFLENPYKFIIPHSEDVNESLKTLDPKELRAQALQALVEEIDKRQLDEIKESFTTYIDQIPVLRKYRNQIYLDITREGLRIQIFDNYRQSMFRRGSDQMYPFLEEILRYLAIALNRVPNRISIVGHSDAQPFLGELKNNWDLSSMRANSARRVLVDSGVFTAKVASVVGIGDSQPLDEANPTSPVNRRISIIVLNRSKDDAEIKERKILNQRFRQFTE